MSYNKLSRISWAGQTVDVNANEMRRLASLSDFAGEGLESAVSLAFANGFPENVSVALQQLPNVAGTDMDKLISKVQVLSVNQATGFWGAAVKEKAVEEWLRQSAGRGTQSSCRSENRTFRGNLFVPRSAHGQGL